MSRRKKKNQREEHKDFWDNISQKFEDSKRGSFEMFDFIESMFIIKKIYLI